MEQNRGQKTWVVELPHGTQHEMLIAWWVMALEEVLAVHQGVVLDGYQLRRNEGYWTLRVQGRRQRKGGVTDFLVTWMNRTRPMMCFEDFAKAVKSNTVEWQTDMYPLFDKKLK